MFDRLEAFHRPRKIPEAVRLLRSGAGHGRFLAGGTDLVVEADRSITSLVDLSQLGLSYIRRTADGVAIGATTTMTEIVASPVIGALAGGILAQAASSWGPVQIRNTATIGGNLAHASPSADMATPLLVLDAAVKVAGERGRRTVPLERFFAGRHQTVLNGSLLVEVMIPAGKRGARAGWSFQKLGRSASDISVVNAAAALEFDTRGNCKAARLALGAVAPAPLRVREAEKRLAGRKLDAAAIEEALEAAMGEISPITDVRASAEYRREIARVLAGRAIRECVERAGVVL
jgi:carbon-monoxide dehydrogenase medium subunit